MYEKNPLVDNSTTLVDGNYPGNGGLQIPVGQAYAFQMNITNAGGAGAMKIQGSADGSNWFDIGYITDASDTIATTSTALTGTGVTIKFLSNPVARRYKYFRLNVSGATGSPKANVDVYAIV